MNYLRAAILSQTLVMETEFDTIFGHITGGGLIPTHGDRPQMNTMNKFIAAFLCFIFPVVAFGSDVSYKVAYDGGSVQGVKAGTDLKLFIEGDHIRIVQNKGDTILIPATAITEISYGQDVHRRVGAAIGLAVFSLGLGALLALSKSKKHFIGLTWDDGGKKGGLALQADKNDYRGLLAGLEGITGKKAVDSDSMNVKN
jgi:hypothetical protein